MVDRGMYCPAWLAFGTGVLMYALISGGSFANTTAKVEADVPRIASHYVLDLSKAWRLALEHDHAYLAAISEQAAAQTERAQGRSGLLPQIQAGYQRSRIKGNARQPGALGIPVSSKLNYDSYNAYVQLQQPVLNRARHADYRLGDARADMGVVAFEAKRRDTGIRLATAYFNVLLANDSRTLQRSLTSSLEAQSAAIDARYRQLEATRLDAQEIAARLAIAQADLIVAEDQWVVAMRELEALLGAAPTHVAGLLEGFPLPPLTPATLDEWLDRALAHNEDVQWARMALRVAGAEIDVATSRYLPTTDLVAVYGRAKSENLSSLSQKTNTFSVGIQVSIPLFSGGYNRANVARARSERTQRQYELRAAIERTLADVTRQYTNVQAGANLIDALRKAVASGELSLLAANKGFTLGVSSNLEVLKVQEQLYQTKNELAQAELEYLLARLKLAAAAGQLDSATFYEVNDTYLDKPIPVSDGRSPAGAAVAYSNR